MSRVRVLLVTGEYPPRHGGIADYSALLRGALADEGIDALVLTADRHDAAGVIAVRDWGWTTGRRIRSVVEERKIDIVHIQYQAGAFGMHGSINLLPLILVRSGTPVVTTFHDLRAPYLFPKAGRFRQFVMLRMARASSAVIVTDPADERTLDRAGIASARIPIGPNLPPPAADPGDVDASTVVFFGFPARSKGITELIAAIATIPARERPVLHLVGAPGRPSADNDILDPLEIDRFAESSGVGIQRTGYVSAQEASNALARAGAVALPFQRGASVRSGSLLAALQSRRPVVTTAPARSNTLGSLASLPQLRLALPDDTVSLRDEMCSALLQPVRYSPLPDEFSWAAIAKRHRDVYAPLAGRRR